MVEQGECCAGEGEKDRERWKIAQGELCDGVWRVVCAEVCVLPGVDEEAVEAAESGEEECGGKQGEAEVGAAGDGGDEGGGGEEEADGDLFWKAVGASSGVDEDEVADDEGAEDEVEVDGFGFEVRKKGCECDGGEDDRRRKAVR